MRAAYMALCLVIGLLSAYYGQPYIHENSDAVNMMVTMFTVFAGFLVAIIVVIGDPAILPSGSWRGAELGREQIEKRLISHMWLFCVYLLIIGLVFISSLLKKVPSDLFPDKYKGWIEYCYLGLGVTAFLFSMALPKMLMDIQRDRVDSEIERRRNAEGIRSDAH